ncbi:hypothetical protein [Methylobacterium sp. JK268]
MEPMHMTHMDDMPEPALPKVGTREAELAASKRGNVSYFPEPPRPGDPQSSRDFSSAIDLIKEASEAIRMAEERAAELDQQVEQLTTRSTEQIKALELQITTLERRLAKSDERARAAEARASEAESWLSRLHDTITTSFRRPPLASEIGREES